VIRALVVDDEAPARAKLCAALADEVDVEVVGEAADGVEAVQAILELTPDLVLLDVQMPRMDGFEVVETIGVGRMPTVVFVTAFDEHALRAFEVQALDYLLKPFARSRLERVLERIRQRPSEPDRALRLESALEAMAPSRAPLRRVLVRRDPYREVLLAVDDILRVTSQRNDLRFHARDGIYTRRGTLAELEARLDPDAFLRLNRSEIVRLEAIREVQPWFHGDQKVVMVDGTVLTWSRRYRARTRTRFEPGGGA
jgi:two-component system, LytTR family, response regulator